MGASGGGFGQAQPPPQSPPLHAGLTAATSSKTCEFGSEGYRSSALSAQSIVPAAGDESHRVERATQKPPVELSRTNCGSRHNKMKNETSTCVVVHVPAKSKDTGRGKRRGGEQSLPFRPE